MTKLVASYIWLHPSACVGPLPTGSEGGRCCSGQWDGYPGWGALPLPPAGQLHRCPAVVSLLDYRIDYTIEWTRNMHNCMVWQLYLLLKCAWHNASAHNTRHSWMMDMLQSAWPLECRQHVQCIHYGGCLCFTADECLQAWRGLRRSCTTRACCTTCWWCTPWCKPSPSSSCSAPSSSAGQPPLIIRHNLSLITSSFSTHLCCLVMAIGHMCKQYLQQLQILWRIVEV